MDGEWVEDEEMAKEVERLMKESNHRLYPYARELASTATHNFVFIDSPALILYITHGCLLSGTFLVPVAVGYIVAERRHLS